MKPLQGLFKKFTKQPQETPFDGLWEFEVLKDVAELKTSVRKAKRYAGTSFLDHQGNFETEPEKQEDRPVFLKNMYNSALFANKHKDSTEAYKGITGLIVDGMRIETARTLNKGTPFHCVHNSALSLAITLCAKGIIIEKTKMEDAICKQFPESFLALYERKEEEDSNQEYNHHKDLLDALEAICYSRRCSETLQSTMEDLFIRIYSHMGQKEKTALQDHLVNSTRFGDDFKEFASEIIDQAKKEPPTPVISLHTTTPE